MQGNNTEKKDKKQKAHHKVLEMNFLKISNHCYCELNFSFAKMVGIDFFLSFYKRHLKHRIFQSYSLEENCTR